eukprot:jgi/Hompol1/5689/HPOL_000816-RA
MANTGPPALYVAPTWPSLYWWLGPTSVGSTVPVLWFTEDMVLFTILWTVIVFFVLFTVAGLLALFMFHRHRLGVFLLLGFSLYGVLIGAISGSIVGALLASFYATRPISMPTWIPLLWAILQAFAVIVYSYSQIAFATL